MAFEDDLGEIKVRSYEAKIDRDRVEDLERRCGVGGVGPTDHALLFIDTLGDPICRIRNSPMYNMLVAESKEEELVGVVQGSIKMVMIHRPERDLAKVGYVLGLRVSPLHRRRGIGSNLVRHLEQWFAVNGVDYAYMATEKDNQASVNLFEKKLGYVKFRTPAILVHPVNNRRFRLSSGTEIVKLKVEHAEYLYRRYMSSAEFFPLDIDRVLKNKLSLGTWVAYPRVGSDAEIGFPGRVPNSWAMVSVWNSGELFKMRLGKAPIPCNLYATASRLVYRAFPCLNVPALPDFLDPFGFYFIYGLHQEGPGSGKLVRTLCKFVHSMAREAKDCKVVVTEVGGGGSTDNLKLHIPHWKLLSCPEDLWCIKALKNGESNSASTDDDDDDHHHHLHEFITKSPPTRSVLFVDPREV